MKSISKIHVRCEGEGINCMWKVTFKDGTVEEFYAYESSPKNNSDDGDVQDRMLSDFLDKMWSRTNPLLLDEMGAVDVDYEAHNSSFRVIKVVQQAS